MNIRELQNKYPSATYSFFHVVNIKAAYENFLNTKDAGLPQFRYSKYLSMERIKERGHQLRADRKTAKKGTLEEMFLAQRQQETKLLEDFLAMRALPTHAITEDRIDAYRKIQLEIHGPVNLELFDGIIHFLQEMAIASNDKVSKDYRAYILQRVKTHSAAPLYLPQPSTFLHYRTLWHTLDKPLHGVLNTIDKHRIYTPEEIAELFQQALEATGTANRGWKVVLNQNSTGVAISRYRKRVVISRQIVPKSSFRLKQIIAHEVGGHVRRIVAQEGNVLDSPRSDEEGLGLLMEQLLASRFIYKRMIRYLAIGLGYGIDGTRRNFPETYEILWRALVILGNDEQNARERAFYETTRAFRGGLPEVPGVIYTKDKIYMESNLALWQKLEKKLLNREEFQQLLDGHDTMPGRGK